MSDDANPYRAPHTREQPPPPESRRLVWKVYAFAVALVQVVAMVLELPRLTTPDAVDYLITLVGTVGLFGFAFRRPIFGLPLWKVWSLLFPLWDIFMGTWLYPRQFGGVIQPGYFAAMLLFLPEYFALLRYAYGSPKLWRKPGLPTT